LEENVPPNYSGNKEVTPQTRGAGLCPRIRDNVKRRPGGQVKRRCQLWKTRTFFRAELSKSVKVAGLAKKLPGESLHSRVLAWS
jgi:hypothetical protein